MYAIYTKIGNILCVNKLPIQWSRRDLYCPFTALIFNILRGLNFLLTEILTTFKCRLIANLMR